MNTTDNLDRGDTGPDFADKTGGSSVRDALEFKSACEGQREAYDESDLAEEITEELVMLLKSGQTNQVGQILYSKMQATIQRRAKIQCSMFKD